MREFGADYDTAQSAYAEAERANEHAGGRLDVVLLSADSLETIKRTHSSYFGDGRECLAELLADCRLLKGGRDRTRDCEVP